MTKARSLSDFIESDGSVTLVDNQKIKVGTGNDLEIYHDGSHSFIYDGGVGDLKLQATNLLLEATDGTNYIHCADDGAVRLYYNGSTKLTTTSTGVDVTGTVVADGLTVDGNATISTAGSTVLNVEATGANDSRVRITAGNTSKSYVEFADPDDVDTGEIRYDHNTNSMEFRVNGNQEAITIDSNKNVGIGATNAEGITSGITTLSICDPVSKTTGDKNGVLAFKTTDGSYTNTYSDAVTAEIYSIAESATGAAYGLGFLTGTISGSDREERLRINNSGIVAVGSTSDAVSNLSGVFRTLDGTGGDRTVAHFGAHNYGDTGKTFVNIGTEYGDGTSRIGSFNDTGNSSVLVFETHSSSSGAFNEAMRMTSDGRLQFSQRAFTDTNNSIGASTNNYLYVEGGSSGLILADNADNSTRILIRDANNIEFQTSDIQRLVLADTYTAFNDTGADCDFLVESASNTHAIFVNAGTDSIHFGTTGNFGGSRINVEHPTDCFGLNLGPSASGERFFLYFNYNGSNTGSIKGDSTGVTYNTTSDIRLKTDIEPIKDSTEKLMSMNPVEHKWKADQDADSVHGFIAQEMQEIVPEAVSGDPEGEEMMSMDYGRITPIIVGALQDAHNKIIELENKLKELGDK